MQHLLELPVGDGEEVAHQMALGGGQRTGLGELVDEEAVALVGGDAPGAGVGLDQVPVVLEHGHLVADRRGRDRHHARTRHVGGAHRLGGLDVLLDHHPQDGGLAIVEHD